jgi:hypothetical protein
VKAIMEHFRCMIGNTAKAWSCYNSRSDGDMLRMSFNCSPLVLRECGVNLFKSRGSSGSIESDYGLDDRAIEVQSPTGAEDFF